MTGKVSIQEMMDHFKKNDLVIVPKNLVYQAKINAAKLVYVQEQLLGRKKSLTLREIAINRLLNVTTKQSINNYIKDGKIFEDEWFVDRNGVKKVLTTAIVRLRKIEGFE